MKGTMQSGANLQTIVGINITPFSQDLSIDFDALGKNLDFLVREGVKAIVPCGNTGEFNALTIEECLEITSFTAKRLKGKATIIAGVGYATGTAIKLAKHAQAAGCDAVMVHHPSNPYLSDKGYVDYIRAIADQVDIAVIPYIRSGRISNASLYELARLPKIVAMKYAVNDMQRFGDLSANTPSDVGITWVCGTAEAWAPFFYTAGATGFTSGLVNVAPQLSFKMLTALQSGDRQQALQLWKQIKPFEDLRARNESEHNVSVVKEAMHQLGLGSRHVRPPITELNDQDRKRVREILQSWGLSPRAAT